MWREGWAERGLGGLVATATAAGELVVKVRRVNPTFLLVGSRMFLLWVRGDGMKGLWSLSFFFVTPPNSQLRIHLAFQILPWLSGMEQKGEECTWDVPDFFPCPSQPPLGGSTAFHNQGLDCSSGRGWRQNSCQVSWKRCPFPPRAPGVPEVETSAGYAW